MGWRAWTVTPRGELTRCFFSAAAGMWKPGWNQARCGTHKHCAPAVDCLCGLHLLTDEEAGWAYVRQRHGGSPWAFGQVEYDGPALGSTVWNDPAGTLRVARARVVGPLALSARADTRSIRRALERRYGVPGAAVWKA